MVQMPKPSEQKDAVSIAAPLSGRGIIGTTASGTTETHGQWNFKRQLALWTSISEPQSSASSIKSASESRASIEISGKGPPAVGTMPSNSTTHHKSVPLRANTVLPDVQEEPSLESCMDLRNSASVPAATVPSKSQRRNSNPASNTTSARTSIGKALFDTLRLQQLGPSKEKRKSMTAKVSSSKEHSRTPSLNINSPTAQGKLLDSI